MKRTLIAFLIAASLAATATDARAALKPDTTVVFANRDTCDLYMDIYKPVPGSITEIGGHRKPTVLFMFGGGFFSGSRKTPEYDEWFGMLVRDGFSVVSIDYRLGLKGCGKPGVNAEFIKKLDNALKVAVQDLYSATLFLLDNGDAFGIDARNMVISGSSAGAFTVMQAEWELCNGSPEAGILPEDFNYAGVMSFSGAVFSHEGAVRYKREPCPILIMHGTEDKIVKYGQMKFFKLCLAGGSAIAKSLGKEGRNYRIYRFEGIGHEIAISMVPNYGTEMDFITENVIGGNVRQVDATVRDSRISNSGWSKIDYRKLYK